MEKRRTEPSDGRFKTEVETGRRAGAVGKAEARREEETLLKGSNADNLTNDVYAATLMSGFMSGNSLRAAAGWRGRCGRSISSAQQGAQEIGRAHV